MYFIILENLVQSSLKNAIDTFFIIVYTVYIQYGGSIKYGMNIVISLTSNQPIYEQIKNQIKQEILNGNLKNGDMLPSIRILAKELNVSVITTKRAYEELEKEGYIITVPAKGTFVGDVNREKIFIDETKEIEEYLKPIVRKAKLLGLGLEKLMEIIKNLYKGDED